MATVASVGAVDRLSFTLFLALGLHALLIFGVGFSAPKHVPFRQPWMSRWHNTAAQSQHRSTKPTFWPMPISKAAVLRMKRHA